MKRTYLLLLLLLLFSCTSKEEKLSVAEKMNQQAVDFVNDEGNHCTITYDSNGADGGTVPQTDDVYIKNQQVTILPDTGELSRDGYYFLCWNTAQDGSGEDFEFGCKITVDGNLVLYPKWKTYDIAWLNNAIRKNDRVLIEQVLNSGLNPAGKDGSTNFSPLLVASEMGNQNLVDLLLNRGFDINSVFYSSTAVFEAATHLHFDLVEHLLSKGADINKGSWLEGETAAMVLIINLLDKNNTNPPDRNQTIEMLNFLIRNGHDINKGAWYGTPLFESIAREDFGITELLLQNGADPHYIQCETKQDLIDMAYGVNPELGKLVASYTY